MLEIGADAARTQLHTLLRRVEKGEAFVITRHGRPVAQLQPVTAQRHDPEQVRGALAALRAFREELSRRGVMLRTALGDTDTWRRRD